MGAVPTPLRGVLRRRRLSKGTSAARTKLSVNLRGEPAPRKRGVYRSLPGRRPAMYSQLEEGCPPLPFLPFTSYVHVLVILCRLSPPEKPTSSLRCPPSSSGGSQF